MRVQVRRGRERILGVADGTYDLAIVSHDEWQIRPLVASALGERASLRIEPLAEHALCLATRKGTPAATDLERSPEGQPVPLAQLSGFALVGLDPQSGLRRQLERHFSDTSSRPSFPIEAGGWEAALEYARHGLGTAVVPLPLLDPTDRRDLVLRLLEPRLVVRDVLLDRSLETSPEHEAFRDALRQAATEEMLRGRRFWQTVFSRGVSP